MKSLEQSSSAKADAYLRDRFDQYEQIDRIYPYPAIPTEVRPVLERCFQIEDINKVDVQDDEVNNSLTRLNEINRTVGLMDTYCREEVCAAAYKAAALGEVMDSADGLGGRQHRSIRSAQELGKFFVNNAGDKNLADDPESIYIAGLLQDRRRLDSFHDLARSKPEDANHELDGEQPSKEEWLSDPAIQTPDKLYDAIQNINLESILISGAETLAKLSENINKPDNDRRTLDLVRYSEQIIAPIAEVTGFDTLAMSLNSATKSIRLINGGEGRLLHYANSMIDRFNGYDRSHSLAHNVRKVFREVLGNLLGRINTENMQVNMPVDYGDDNKSVYGDTPVHEVMTSEGPVEVSWRFRLKTPGSLAWKLHKSLQHGEDISQTPLDILGVTAVVKSDDDQEKLFRALANGLYDSNDLLPHPSPSKVSPVHIRGMPAYIKRMIRGIKAPEVDTKECKSEEALHYAKITGFFRNLPFEVQCVTRHFRDSMQIGPLAHIIYKVNAVGRLSKEEVDRWVRLLADIRGRRSRLGTPGLVGSYDKDPMTDEYIRGVNEIKARELLEQMVESTGDMERTVGFIATNSLVASGEFISDPDGEDNNR